MTIVAPANTPSAITVGVMKTMGTITRSDDLIASYSSRGPSFLDMVAKPDLVAPGNLEVSLLSPGSTLATANPQSIVGKSYLTLSGTSMAAPAVSGTVALMLQKSPGLSPDTIKARLMQSASKNFPASSTTTDATTGKRYTDYYDIFTVGAGYLDVAAALSSTVNASGNTLSPSVAYNNVLGNASMVLPAGAIWVREYRPSTACGARWCW